MIDEHLAKIRQYQKENILRKRDELINKSHPNSNLNINDYYVLKRVRRIDISKVKFYFNLLMYLGVYLAFRSLVWIYDIYEGNLQYVVAELFGIFVGMLIMSLVFLLFIKGKFYYEFDCDKFSKDITDNQADVANNLIDINNRVSDKK